MSGEQKGAVLLKFYVIQIGARKLSIRSNDKEIAGLSLSLGCGGTTATGCE